MTDLAVTAGDVAGFNEEGFWELIPGPAGEAITAGQAVRYDTTTGKFMIANGTTAAEARCCGIALTSANVANRTITVLRQGYVDLGDALSALTYDDDVYLSDTDGALADTAGTVGVYIGTVVPVFGATTPDKVLRVDVKYVDVVEAGDA